MEQIVPCVGSTPSRHDPHTGNLEMLVREAAQIRHSEGNNVANKLSAAQVTDSISEAYHHACCFAADRDARIGIPLLLKTSLPRPADATGAPSWTIASKYSGPARVHAMYERIHSYSGLESLHACLLKDSSVRLVKYIAHMLRCAVLSYSSASIRGMKS